MSALKKYSTLIFVGGWLLLTVSMTSWWLVYGLMVVRKMAAGAQINPGEVVRGQHMLHWEGGFLILLLILGGISLFYYSLREFNRSRQIEQFFATLTHELKTPLASVRLQVESLQEDLAETEHLKLVNRLAKDAARLELQLENALFLASVRDAHQLHLEKLKIKKILSGLKQTWPEIEVGVPDQCVVVADLRALEAILKNLVQNARIHGQATQVRISSKNEDDRVRLSVEDNGRGFKGDTKKLGRLFTRHTAVSGSGIGLYLAQQLTEKMKGRLEFDTGASQGFTAHLILPGGSSGSSP